MQTSASGHLLVSRPPSPSFALRSCKLSAAMNRRSISIDDIAHVAGVSNSTVSRALRDSSLISAEVRAHIQRLAQEMGYTPNGIAQSLQTRRTNTIGLVVTSIADPYFSDVMKGVEEVARPANLSVFLS